MNEAPDGLVDCSEGAETRHPVDPELVALRASVKRLQGEVDVLASLSRTRGYLSDLQDLEDARLRLQLARRELEKLESDVRTFRRDGGEP
jgi:hypothetical protein